MTARSQSRLDAECDARAFKAVLPMTRAPLPVEDGAVDAEGYGIFAAMFAQSLILGDAAYDFARLAARAAFRAVPALKEDR